MIEVLSSETTVSPSAGHYEYLSTTAYTHYPGILIISMTLWIIKSANYY